jgi:predicted acetyltransferase
MDIITVQLCDQETKAVINNMYPLYLHDLSGIRDVLPNKYGVFEESDDYQTLQQQIAVFDIWWEKEGVLFPLLIRVNDVPAGFALIATPPYVYGESNYLVNEYFIMRPFRGKGVGEYAAIEIFNRFQGKWMLYTTPTEKNRKAIAFWRKTLHRYTDNQFTEEDKELGGAGLCKIFNFSSKAIE